MPVVDFKPPKLSDVHTAANTCTPEAGADTQSVLMKGIQERIDVKQTARVVIDLRNTRLTRAEVRTAVQAIRRRHGN